MKISLFNGLFLRLFLLFVLSLSMVNIVFAGGSFISIYDVDSGNRYLSLGQKDQELMAFTVELSDQLNSDIVLDSLDITCSPSFGFGHANLIVDGSEVGSSDFVENARIKANQTVHFESDDYLFKPGTINNVSLLVDVDSDVDPYVTSCVIDTIFFRNLNDGSIYDDFNENVYFSELKSLVYVGLYSDQHDSFTVKDNLFVLEKMDFGSQNVLLMDVDVTAMENMRLKDLFLFCDNGASIEDYRLNVNVVGVDPSAMQNDSTTFSRPEFSISDKLVVSDINAVMSEGDVVNLKLYGNSYDYFKNADESGLKCEIIDIMPDVKPFPDVLGRYPYVESIFWMLKNGVVTGYDDDTFRPNSCVNRAEFLKMLYVASGVDVSSDYLQSSLNGTFSDVVGDEWFSPYLSVAVSEGVVEGYEDGTFRPADGVSRVEAIKMGIEGFDFDIESTTIMNINDFPYDLAVMTDKSKNESWWWNYSLKAFELSLVGVEHFGRVAVDLTAVTDDDISISCNSYDFEPNECMTRGEVVEMLYRMKDVRDHNLDFTGGGYIWAFKAGYTPDDVNLFKLNRLDK